MTILIIASLVALGGLYACLRRAPLITMLSVGLLGWAFQTRVLRVPPVIAGPIAGAGATLHGWQQRQSATLGCEIARTNDLVRPGGHQIGRLGDLAPAPCNY